MLTTGLDTSDRYPLILLYCINERVVLFTAVSMYLFGDNLETISKAQYKKGKTAKLDFTKINFSVKDIVKTMKRQAIHWENV